MNKKRLGILGSGYLSGIVVDAWKQGLLEDYEIVGVMGRTPETVSEMAKKPDVQPALLWKSFWPRNRTILQRRLLYRW